MSRIGKTDHIGRNREHSSGWLDKKENDLGWENISASSRDCLTRILNIFLGNSLLVKFF
jgi:hypothetical protein